MCKVGRSWLAFAVSVSVSVSVAGCGPEMADPSAFETTPEALTVAGQGPSYLVSFTGGSIPPDAATVISKAGGTLAASYTNIGVVLARSTDGSFATKLRANTRIESVGLARAVSTSIMPKRVTSSHHGSPKPPQGGSDPLSFRQWDMDQIKAPQARAISGGKSSVLVGVLDSGIDITHPDLAGQVLASASVSCVGGVADTNPTVWSNDVFGHGTHVAGIIAAKKNNVGIVGVAPGVKLAAVKVAVDDLERPDAGQIYADAFVCAIDWAISHNFDLMNASLSIDPFTGVDDDAFCTDNADRFAILKMVRRAIFIAGSKKVTLVAAAGNDARDLANFQGDPSNGSANCKVIPVQLPRVIGVSMVGVTRSLTYFSNYGARAIDLTGPGGDDSIPYPLVTDTTASGQVLSSMPPGSLFYDWAAGWDGQVQDCSSGTCSTYAYMEGTSMAAPHVTGVAALAISRFGKMTPEALRLRLSVTATHLACPPNPYDPSGSGTPFTCTGTALYNNFYGAGEVDALAISK